MNPEISSTRSTSSRAEAMPIAVAFLVLVFGFSGIAQAATIPFSYIINGGSLTTGLPPTLSETFTGSGVVTPFGVATYSDSGTLTVGQFSPGVFGPMVLDVTYVLSFNGGVDTFFGGEVVSFSAPDMNGVQASTATMTILGGTGIFKQATGSGIGSAKSSPLPPTGPAPVTISGSGQITAPGLTAVPEPGTLALLGAGVAGLAGLAAIRKRRRSRIGSAIRPVTGKWF